MKFTVPDNFINVQNAFCTRLRQRFVKLDKNPI